MLFQGGTPLEDLHAFCTVRCLQFVSVPPGAQLGFIKYSFLVSETNKPGAESAPTLKPQRVNDSADNQALAHTEHSAVGDLVHSAAYSLQNSVSGAAQIVDKALGTSILPYLQIVGPPEQTKPYSLNWFAQQVGSGIGMAPGFIAASHVVRGGFRLAGPAAPEFFGAEALTASKMAVADGAVSGFAFGSLLTPTAPDSTSFIGDRVKQGVESAATFGTLALGSIGWRALGTTSPIAREFLSHPVVGNFAGGVPAGFAGAQAHAQLFDGRWANRDEIGQSVVGMAAAGVALPVFHHAFSKGADFYNLQRGNGIRIEKYLGSLGKDVRSVLSANANLQSLSGVRVQIDGTIKTPEYNRGGRMIRVPRAESEALPGTISGLFKSISNWNGLLLPKGDSALIEHETVHARNKPAESRDWETHKQERLNQELEARNGQIRVLRALGREAEVSGINIAPAEILAQNLSKDQNYGDIWKAQFDKYAAGRLEPDSFTEYSGDKPVHPMQKDIIAKLNELRLDQQTGIGDRVSLDEIQRFCEACMAGPQRLEFGSAPGYQYEAAAQKAISRIINDPYLPDDRFRDWVYMSCNHGSFADRIGMDGILLNVFDKRIMPVDIKSYDQPRSDEKSNWNLYLGQRTRTGEFVDDMDGVLQTQLLNWIERPGSTGINGSQFIGLGGTLPFPSMDSHRAAAPGFRSWAKNALSSPDEIVRCLLEKPMQLLITPSE